MSVHSSNSRFSHPRGNNCGPNQFRSGTTQVACQICDKIFDNHLDLIDHYERHRNEHRRGNRPSNRLNRRRTSFTSHQNPASSLALQQRRHHPYLPNGYRPLLPRVPQRIPVAATMAPHFQYLRNLNTNSPLNVTSLNLPTINGNHVANNKQLVTHQYMHKSLVSPRLNPLVASQLVQSQQARGNTTVWYLGHLEKPISKMSPEKNHEYIHLDLTLKL